MVSLAFTKILEACENIECSFLVTLYISRFCPMILAQLIFSTSTRGDIKMRSSHGWVLVGYWVGSIKLTIPCNCKGLASRLPGILPIGVPAKQTEPPTMDLNSTAASYSNQHRAKPQGQPHYHHITTHQNMRFVDGIPLLNVDTDIYMDRSKLLL